jgi:hypothetical protein
MILRIVNIYRIPIFILSLSLIIAVVIVTGLRAQTTGEMTIQDYLEDAQKSCNDAKALFDALNAALEAAKAKGDTKAVLLLDDALKQVDVWQQRACSAVEQVRQAKTPADAEAAAKDAQQALEKINEIIQKLPQDVYQEYVAPFITTTVGTTTVKPTEETTEETTIFTTTTTSTTSTIRPVSPSR